MKNHFGLNCPISWSDVPENCNFICVNVFDTEKKVWNNYLGVFEKEYCIQIMATKNLPFSQVQGFEGELFWETEESDYYLMEVKLPKTEASIQCEKITGFRSLVCEIGKCIWQRPQL
jgi:hypothetical protein